MSTRRPAPHPPSPRPAALTRHRVPAALVPVLLAVTALLTVTVVLAWLASPAGAEPTGPIQVTLPPPEVVWSDLPPDPPVADVNNPNSSNYLFVVAAYPSLLGRGHDTDGLNYHLARLASGGDRAREAFAFALAFSPEGSGRQVERAYDDLLNRSPDPGGRDYWTAHLQGHGVVDLRVLLLASDEYRLRAGATDGAWIDALYSDVLGRSPDDAGRAYWLGRAQAGVPRALIAASIYQSDESLGRRVQALYQQFLTRPASAGEQAGAVAFIRATDERNLQARLLASDEAYEPFYQAQPGQ